MESCCLSRTWISKLRVSAAVFVPVSCWSSPPWSWLTCFCVHGGGRFSLLRRQFRCLWPRTDCASSRSWSLELEWIRGSSTGSSITMEGSFSLVSQWLRLARCYGCCTEPSSRRCRRAACRPRRKISVFEWIKLGIRIIGELVNILHIVGARPNFMKVAPVLRALKGREHVVQTLIHTGQHYDVNMSDVFFLQQGITARYVNLAVGSGTQRSRRRRS